MTSPLHPQQSIASLYVGDLQPEVTEALLFEIFSQYGHVSSIRVCRDYTTRRSLGYAYVNFQSQLDAKRAMDTLNFQPIRDQPCRIMWSSRDPTLRKSAVGNLYVKGLDPSFDNQKLYQTFAQFGAILSCKVALDRNLKRKGFGFVHFAREEDAKNCIQTLNGQSISGNSKPLVVTKFERKANRQTNQTAFTNLYVKHVPREWGSDQFRRAFEKFGKITSAVLKSDPRDSSQHCGFGFVNYEDHTQAARAIDEGSKVSAGDKTLFVTRFQTIEERRANLDKIQSDFKRQNYEKYKGRNLHIKNLEEEMDDNEIRNIFSRFGPITSVKIERDERGTSKCFGFICFESAEDAKKAVDEMNMDIPDGRNKPMHVGFFQTKEERKAYLDQQHMNASMRTPISYPIFIPQVQGAVPQFVPQPRQQYIGAPMIPTAMRQQQPFIQAAQRGGRIQRPNMGPRPTFSPTTRPREVVPMPGAVRTQATPDQFLNALTKASPEEQKHMLGERLFPLVYKERPGDAAKITGMILELDVSELVSFLESTDALKKKVQEAVRVLEEYNANAPQ